MLYVSTAKNKTFYGGEIDFPSVVETKLKKDDFNSCAQSRVLVLSCFDESLILTLYSNRIIPSGRRTEGGGFPADDPGPRAAVRHPVVGVRLGLRVVQRPPVPLLLFILSALMRRESF